VANYNVDIKLELQGEAKLRAFRENLSKAADQAERLQEAVSGRGRTLGDVFAQQDRDRLKIHENLVKIEQKALGIDKESIKNNNAILDQKAEEFLQNERLINQEKVRQSIANKRRQVEEARGRRQAIGRGLESAVIGGAFPLLFGQGLGAAVGGAAGGFGGGVLGGQLGFGLSLVGTQVGSIVDQLATKASELGTALNPLTADIEALTTAAGESNTEFGQLLAAYEEQVGAQEALEFATNRLATVVGLDGVNALSTFNSDMVDATNEFSKFTSVVLAGIADLINRAGILRGAANLAERSRLLVSAQTSGDPEVQKLMRQRRVAQGNVQSFLGEVAPDRVAGQIAAVRSIEDQIILLQRANEAKELGLQQDELSAKFSEKQLQGLRGSRAELEARNVILKNNGDLLNQEVFNAEKILLEEKMRAKVAKITRTQEEAKVKLSKDAFDEQLAQAVLDYNNDLLALTNRRADAQQAADDKAKRAADKASNKAEREDRRKQRAIERRIEAADRELKRATAAFDKVDSQLDAIITKNKDKVAFEREYAELIRNGSTPAAARQAIELKKQQLELDRNFEKLKEQLDLQVKVAEAAILEAKARGASGAELDALNQALADLLDKIGKLPGKKENAEGAILEALAPKSDRERLQEYLDKLQGQLNDLNDPVKQIIGLAETLGSAFSESFKGIVTGSMSAREALANLFQRTADHFLDMAAQMIAAQIKMQVVGLFMNFLNPYGSMMAPGGRYEGMPKGQLPPTPPPLPPLPGKALGGAVGAGRPYMVGERGPELFVPGAQGNIVPNNAMGGSNIVVNVDASGSSVEGDSDQAAQLGKMLGAAVQAELVKQKRPGGLLAS
jgi:hypothetical protein